jgi:lipid II:glycine glycyltransferase (peptidoglycan interpeptide bridge formation enzyme)
MSVSNVNNKIDKYRILCTQEPTIPLFSQACWLDATAGVGMWDVALVLENGQIVASMPYVVKKKFGFTIVTQPILTQSLGPWVRPSMAKYSRELALQHKRIKELFIQLPKFDHFQQSWHYSVGNWLPAYWMGYQVTTRYTYIVSDLNNLEKVLSNFDSSYRNKINKAKKIVLAKHDLPIDDFYKINSLTFDRQKIKAPYSLEFIRLHDTKLSEIGKRKIFFAEDSEGRIHSALYLTWDYHSSYVHMVGEDPSLRNSGAGILLIWEAMKYTVNVLKLDRFDFEGSIMENVEPVRRDCGGVQTPYFTVSKTTSRLLKLALFLRSFK